METLITQEESENTLTLLMLWQCVKLILFLDLRREKKTLSWYELNLASCCTHSLPTLISDNIYQSYSQFWVKILCSCACDLFSSVQGYWAAKSRGTAKSCVYICKDVPVWLHKSERIHLWPQPDPVPPNHSHKLQSIPLCLSTSSLPLGLICFNSITNTFSRSTVRLSLYAWCQTAMKEKPNRWLCEIYFYCSNQQEICC